ncbi:phage tail length tape measure family protein [Leisingera methylohalidivorans]|uniref:Bacteriophage tail tape measure N-terminal domain-containing protein n=1 Tax=Leisingera methylohalidivorans DSM 14336 TaxID=999552 RepID=V9W1P7_9RHOB|nr:phage tail length tape measure family protein [Leisingera methylohalidivorans]AHD03097.1 hypothetical protein METH_11360 [Leisingera methylohalidivorans DSM 14336]
MDASQGKQELAELKGAKDAAGKSAEVLSFAEAKAAAEIKKLGTASGAAAGQAEVLDAAQEGLANNVVRVGQNSALAAGQVGNLTAQFNDIWVMLAAGQAPVQLALQQGTQITQVFGNAGAAGAVNMLRQGLLRMISPLNLLTIGGIAAGAALFQWLTSAGDEARTFEDAIGDLENQMKAYAEAAEAASVSTNDLQSKFGDAWQEAQILLDGLRENALTTLKLEAEATIAVTLDESGLDLNSFRLDDRLELSGLFDFDVFYGEFRRTHKSLIDEVLNDFEGLGAAANGSVQDQVQAVEELITSFETAAQFSGKITEEENAQLAMLRQLALKLREIQAMEDGRDAASEAKAQALSKELAAEEALTAAIEAHGQKSAEVHNLKIAQAREAFLAKVEELRISDELKASLLEQWNAANEARDPYQERLASAYAYYAQTRTASQEQQQDAQTLIASLQQEAALRQAMNEQGAGSVEVAELRLQAEREAFQQQVDALDVSEELKDELMAAWDAANGVADADIAGNITLAADEAHRLKTNLLEAQGKEIMGGIGANPDFNDPRGESAGAGNPDYIHRNQGLPDVDMPPNPRKSRRGGASQSEKERKAVERLIAAETRRLDILKETNPVMQEMIRHRDVLKDATDAERKAVEAIIRQRLEEEKALEQTKEAADWLKATGQDLGDALTTSGDAAADAWDRVKEAIIKAAAEAVLFGNGPLAEIFGIGSGLLGGGSGSGGETDLLGNFVSGVFGLADGTVGMMVYGDGGNRDDKVPTMLSAGESVITGKATRRYRPILQAMNDGVEIPGFASGIVPGAAASAPSAAAAAGQTRPTITVRLLPSPMFEAVVEERASEISVEVVRDYDQGPARSTVKDTLEDPYKV